jgi:PAS domain S-box-containing protein
MPRGWVDLSLRTKSLVVIAIPMIPLLVSSALFADSARRARMAQESVAHTLEVKAQTATVLASIVDAETGVLGFLLTNSDESLGVYQNAVAVFQPAMRQLSKLIADNPTQVEHLRTIMALAATRPLTSLLDYARTASVPTPSPLALLAESHTTMAALRAEFADMQNVEDGLLAARTVAAANAQRRQVQVSILGAALGLLGGVIAALAFSAGVASRIRLLGENATRLSQGEPLRVLAPASDEVGQVSRRLDEAATLLTQRVQELQETRDELDRFFSLSLDLLCIVGPDGRFTRVNPAWHPVFGWTDAELCAVPYLEFVHDDDKASTLAAGAQLTEGAPVINFENRYRCKDGSYRWLNWQATPLSQRDVVYATARDVTERRS